MSIFIDIIYYLIYLPTWYNITYCKKYLHDILSLIFAFVMKNYSPSSLKIIIDYILIFYSIITFLFSLFLLFILYYLVIMKNINTNQGDNCAQKDKKMFIKPTKFFTLASIYRCIFYSFILFIIYYYF